MAVMRNLIARAQQRVELDVLARMVPWLAPVKVAETEAERDAIHRLRYEVLVHEHNRPLAGIDHHRRTLRTPADDAPEALHLYSGPAGAPTGALRITSWPIRGAPPEIAERFSLHLIEEDVRIAVVDYFVAAPAGRASEGGMAASTLSQASYLTMARDLEVDLVFYASRPGDVPFFRRLGARPYGAAPIAGPQGIEVALVSVLSDEAYLQRRSAAAAPLVRRVFGPGRKRRPLDQTRLNRLFERGDLAVVAEERAVLEEVRAARARAQGVFLNTISADALPVLAGQGLVIHVDRGSILTHKASREREAFVILEGTLEIFDGDRVLATAGPGHLVGEGSLFRPSGERAASIRARDDARIMVLRRRFLVELARVAPEVAVDVMLAMGNELSERLRSS